MMEGDENGLKLAHGPSSLAIRNGRIYLLTAWLLILFGMDHAVGQSTGQVQLYVSPMKEMRYILNMQERSESNVLRLPAGEHRFTFWAPDRLILDTTITVIADSVVKFYKTLPPSPEYLEHRAALGRIGKQRLMWRGIPILATAVGGVLTVNAMNKQEKAYDALLDAEASYLALREPLAIRQLKQETIPDRQTDLDNARRNVVVSGVLTGAALATVVYGFIRTGGMEAPVYEDKQRVRFEGLAWSPGAVGGWTATLTMPIR